MKSLPAILRSPMTWLLVVIVVAAVFVFTSSDDPVADIGTETAPVDISSALPTFDGTDPDPAVGLAAPTVTASLLGGGAYEIAPGTPRLIAFFAHWCPHCQAEVPVVRDWLATTTLPDGLEVVAVSTAVDDGADNYPPSEWFAEEAWPTPVLLDDVDSSLAASFGLTRFPYWVAVDAAGAVVARTTGELTAAQLDTLVAATTVVSP